MTCPSDYEYCPYDGNRLAVDRDDPEGRPACSRCGFVDYQNPKACVAVLIVRGDKLLLAKRGVEPAKGEWDIPGGFVDRDESAEEAVVREMCEETGLRVRVTDYLGSVPDVYGLRQTPTLNLCFLVETPTGEPKAQSDVEELQWVSLDELPNKMAFAHQQQVVELLRNRIGVDQ